MINYISTASSPTPCPKCAVTKRGGILSLLKQIGDEWFLTCNYDSVCDGREKTKAPVVQQQAPAQIQFSDPTDMYPGSSSGNKLICETLARGSKGSLRDRLEKTNKKSRRDPDISINQGGYLVSENNYVMTEGGWSQQ
jgi:hypothetical protein